MIAPVSRCDCTSHIAFWGDEARERARLLKVAGQTPSSWDELYRCRTCGQYWDLTFPGVGNLCSVDPELLRVSEREAREKYGKGLQESLPMTGTGSDAREREAERR